MNTLEIDSGVWSESIQNVWLDPVLAEIEEFSHYFNRSRADCG